MKKAFRYSLVIITIIYAFVIISAVIHRCHSELFISLSSIENKFDNHNEHVISHGKININTASASDLTEIPGIGDTLSSRIVEYRSMNGPYSSTEDLLAVKGIGEKLLNKIRNYITIGD